MTDKNPCDAFDEAADNILWMERQNPGSVSHGPATSAPAPTPLVQAPPPSARKPEYLPTFANTTLVTANVYHNRVPPTVKDKRQRKSKLLKEFGIGVQFFDFTEPFTPHYTIAALNATCGHTRSPDEAERWLDDYEQDHVGAVSQEQSTRFREIIKEARTIHTSSPYPVIGLPFTKTGGQTLYFDAVCLFYERTDEMRLIIAMPGGRISIDLYDVETEGTKKLPKWRGHYDPNHLWLRKRK